MQVGRVICTMSEEDTTDFSELKEKLKTADLNEVSNLVDNIEDGELESDNFEMKNVYTSIPNSDYIWLETLAARNGASKSFIIKRIIHNARVREAFDAKELI